MGDGAIDHPPYAISPQPSAIDSDRHRAAATIADLRKRDATLAVDERRASICRAAGPAQTHHSRETPVTARHQVKTRLAARPACALLAGHEHAVALGEHPNRSCVDARQIDGDLESVVGLVDIEWR